MTPTRRWTGGAATATPSQSAPAAQPVQQNEQRPRDDCPEKDGDGSSSGSSGSEQQF